MPSSHFVSVVYAVALCLSVCLCICLSVKNLVFYRFSEWIKLAFYRGFLSLILHVFWRNWVTPKIRVLPSGTLSQTVALEKFCHGISTVARVSLDWRPSTFYHSGCLSVLCRTQWVVTEPCHHAVSCTVLCDFAVVYVRRGWYHFPTSLCLISRSASHCWDSCWRLVSLCVCVCVYVGRITGVRRMSRMSLCLVRT